MKQHIFPILLGVALLLQVHANAQSSDFSDRRQEQERTIKAAYKADRITRIEYNKLMHEQNVIKETMMKFQADDDFTPKEKNTIYDKLERADKRLKKYKSNGEVY